MRKDLSACFFTALALGLAACSVGPNYRRPALDEPASFRFDAGGSSLGELDWRSVYQDPALRRLIEEALAVNLDLKEAAARVLRAQADLAIARAAFFPAIGAGYDFTKTDVRTTLAPGMLDLSLGFDIQQHNAGLSLLQYEADFWGKIRRSNEAARARLLATEEARRMVEVGLIASLATAYITLREQDFELEIARRTLDSRKKSLDLISTRQKGGQSPLTDVKQAEVLVAEAEAAIAEAEREIGQLENLISYLVARPPGSIRRGQSFGTVRLVSVPGAGLPSDLINRRPDVRAAEQALVAATAAIGVAQAQLLPSFTLTGAAGLRSREFSGLFDDPTRLWTLGPAVNVPVFAGGRLLAGIRGSKAARDEAEAGYRKQVLQALREVSDALLARQKNAALHAARDRVVTAREEALVLIRERYDNGATSYLEVLYNDQELFAAELNRARAKLKELLAVVELYRALGGGWDRASAPARFSGGAERDFSADSPEPAPRRSWFSRKSDKPEP